MARKSKPRFLPEDQETNPYRRLPSGLGSGATQPIFIDDEESENEATFASKHSKSPFSKTNFFQSRGRKQSHQQYHTAPSTQRKKRQSRSPSTSSSSSEGGLTPDSSGDVFYPALTTPIAQPESQSPTQLPYLKQPSITTNRREQNRGLAQNLQQHEDNAHDTSQPSLLEELRSVALPNPTQKRLSRKKSPALSPKRAIYHRGTREDPINLVSDSDEPDKIDAEATTRAQDYGALYGEPMELDDTSSDLALSTEDLSWSINKAENQDANAATLLQAKENWNRQAPPASRECAVCGEDFPIIGLPFLANCTHHPETCAGCYTEWITTQLQGNSWREVKCPGSECKITLAYHEIQQYADPEIFQQYDTFIARAAFNEDPNFRWCRNCDFGQIHLNGVEGNIFTCAACGHKVCVLHENTWHEGETCEEYEYRSSGRKERDQKAQEEASLQAIGKLSKKCPGPNCVYNIEKNDGCDHMTCSKCRYEFCWICLCDYNSVRRLGNSAHTTDCNYHTRRLA